MFNSCAGRYFQKSARWCISELVKYTVVLKSLRPPVTSYCVGINFGCMRFSFACLLKLNLSNKWYTTEARKHHLYTLLFQYFVRPLLFFTTAAILWGMLSIRLEQYAGEVFWVHTIFIAVFHDSILVGCWSATSFFITCHKFSIGFRSRLFPGQSRISTFFSHRKLFTDFALWHGDHCAWRHCNRAEPRGSPTYPWVDQSILCHLWWYLVGENTDQQYHGQTLLPRLWCLEGVSLVWMV